MTTGGRSLLLDAHLVVVRGGFRLDLTLAIRRGEVVALLGPNGSGKTTAIRALAGLEALTDGHVTIGRRDLARPVRRVWTPPHQRPVGVVFQDYLLFPHMTTLDNVAFGPRRHGVTRRLARAQAATWLERVGLTEFAHRKPRQLSGGQAQRVALARALAVRPELLLLDEPLSALDARARLDTRTELHRHLAEHSGATLLVTHDPLDAFVLADRLIIIEDGGRVQEGDAATITSRPQTDYVAQLVGLNLFRGWASRNTVDLGGGVVLTTADTVDGDTFVAFAPQAITLQTRRPQHGPPNAWAATVASVQRHGDNLRVNLSGSLDVFADVSPTAAAELRLLLGQEVWATVASDAIRTYPPAPGASGLGPAA